MYIPCTRLSVRLKKNACSRRRERCLPHFMFTVKRTNQTFITSCDLRESRVPKSMNNSKIELIRNAGIDIENQSCMSYITLLSMIMIRGTITRRRSRDRQTLFA